MTGFRFTYPGVSIAVNSCISRKQIVFSILQKSLTFIYLLTIRICFLLETTIYRELKLFCQWLDANKLSLNVKKSNYVIFLPRQKKL